MEQLRQFDHLGKEIFGNRLMPWVARWILEKPPEDIFYPQQFRNELGQEVVNQGMSMPDVNKALTKFEELGMVERVAFQDPSRPNIVWYEFVDSDNWLPYIELLDGYYQS